MAYRQRIEDLFVRTSDGIRLAVACINRSLGLAAIVVEGPGKFVDVITDGDIRRAILDGMSLEASIADLLGHKKSLMEHHPVVARDNLSKEELLRLLGDKEVSIAPLLDSSGTVVDLACVDDLMPDCMPNLQAVVMAGGLGTRLRPLTTNTPKPMLLVGDRPLLELTIESLKSAGISRVNVTTHFMPEKIQEHFGDGSEFGVQINYFNEDTPLGTAGALTVMGQVNEPLLVINGDVLTQVDFRAMLSFHREHNAALTVAVRQLNVPVPFGVVDCHGVSVTAVREKPTYNFLVSAGVYLLEPSVCKSVPKGSRFDMPDLINRLIQNGQSVVSFPIMEYWLDIGQPMDYAKAQEDARAGVFTSDEANSMTNLAVK
jgi:dTDP-glucose pyrophosphorylase